MSASLPPFIPAQRRAGPTPLRDVIPRRKARGSAQGTICWPLRGHRICPPDCPKGVNDMPKKAED